MRNWNGRSEERNETQLRAAAHVIGRVLGFSSHAGISCLYVVSSPTTYLLYIGNSFLFPLVVFETAGLSITRVRINAARSPPYGRNLPILTILRLPFNNV